MDWNSMMYWLVGAGYLSLFFASRAFKQARLDWLIAAQLPLVLILGTWLYFPNYAGFVGGISWLLLMVIPPLFMRGATRAGLEHHWRLAAGLAGAALLLHPVREWRHRFGCVRAAALIRSGRMNEGRQRLLRLVHGRDSMLAISLLYQLDADWAGLINWLNSHREYLRDEPLVAAISLEVRALGETLQLRQMMERASLATRLVQNGELSRRTVNELVEWILAFSGNREDFLHLIASAKPSLERDYRNAVSLEISGDRLAALREFKRLGMSEDGFLAAAVRRRLDQPIETHPDLPHIMAGPSRQFARVFSRMRPIDPLLRLAPLDQQPWVTWWLLVANCCVFFIVELQGGQANDHVYDQFGAMIPYKCFEGEWWRIITANFLHYGMLHLFFNMLGLFTLGKYIEQRLGSMNFLCLYFVNGLGSMLLVAWLMRLRGEDGVMVVGASGAIMGLVGFLCAAWFRAWREGQVNRLGSARLLPLAILFQALFDLVNPFTSMSAHMTGAALGFAVGLLFFLRCKATRP